MAQFDKSYFLRHYRSPEDKSSPKKLLYYLSIIKQFAPHRNWKPTLLDIGCGYGKFLEKASQDFRVSGIDPSEYSIQEVQRLIPRVTVSVSTLEAFHPKKCYDVVTAFDVLEHLKDPRRTIEKIYRLLPDDGVFVCVVPVYDGPFGTIGGWLDRDPTHLHKWDRWKWLRLFEEKFHILFREGIIRYTLPIFGYYLYASASWFWRWGQAIVVVLKKR